MDIQEIRFQITHLIQMENARKPLSDEQLTAALQELGIRVAKRDVAKYREEIGYPVASMRKR